jgi:hypothetical protein
LEPNIKKKFEEKTKAHLTFTDLNRDAQLKQLNIYLAIATQCEEDVNATTSIVCQAMGDTHSFLASIMQKLDVPAPDHENYDNPASYVSAAEKTLREHRGTKHNMSDSDIKILCWGCNGPHPYRDRHTKEIICPNKDKPGVAEAAKVAHQKYLQGLKKSRQGWVQKKKVKFSDLSSDEKERFRQHLASQANSTLAINNVRTANIQNNATPANSTPSAFLFPAFVLQNQISKPILPVKIDNNLPFITLILGSPDAPIEECPAVRVLVDTDAGLSTGYWGYWSHLLKAHPDCVENMWTVADGVHGPVVLGGVIVGDGGDMTNHTTELPPLLDDSWSTCHPQHCNGQ